MKNTDSESIEPYKLLFPLGVGIAFIGLILWVLFKYRFLNFYPRQAHANLMFFGFLWSFVAGFLMTAIPKMTKTFSAQYFEISVILFLVFLQLVLNLRNAIYFSAIVLVFQNIFLLFFILRRFLVFKKLPFKGMIFIPLAFLMSLTGVLLYIFNESQTQYLYVLAGEAFFLNLIIGLGSRLIPVISRIPDSLLPTDQDIHKAKSAHYLYYSLAFTFNSGFLLKAFQFTDFGVILIVLSLIMASVFLFKIHIKPIVKGFLPYGLKVANLFMILGYLLSLTFFKFELAAQHIVFISGFTLITILISMRVILAHGGQSLDYEVSSKRILVMISFFILAALFRYLMKNQFQSDYLIFSIIFFLLSLSLWSKKFYLIYRHKF